MNTLITYPSSYSFWMNQNPPLRRKEFDFLNEGCFTVNANSDYYANLAAHFHLFAPLHLLVSQSKDRRSNESIRCHTLPLNLTSGSVVEIEPSIYVISPELTFLFAAKELSFPKLVKAANNLCGTYYYINGVQQYRNPITSVQELRQYLGNISNITGLRNAKAALQYASERSNSPMETKMATICMLPLSRGGCTLLPPKLNYQVLFSKEGRALINRDSCCCDMVWPEQKVIVEYDSKQFHMNEEQFAYDKKRVSALNLSGFQVISATNANLVSPDTTETLFCLIQKSLGMKFRQKRFAKYKKLRFETIKEIFYDPEAWQYWPGPTDRNHN